MVLQWATKRLCKFFLKRLSKFLNEEIDVEQLDVQLGSGTGTLTDLFINVDYVNDQVRSLPFVLKYGCISRIVVRLPCEIEVDGLELLVAPRQGGGGLSPGLSSDGGVYGGSAQQPRGGDTGVPPYMSVSDGVRVIGQIIKNFLLGLRVCVRNVTVGLEGHAKSKSYVTLRVPTLKYGFEESNEKGGRTSKVINFDNASVDIGTEKKVRLLDENGLSGSVQVTIPCNETAALAQSNIELDIVLEPVHLKASVEDVNYLVAVAQSYVVCDLAAQGSVYHDTSSFYESVIQGHKSFIFDATRSFEAFSSASRSTLSVIADWMRKPEVSEPDLAASMDEFFECYEAWQQSASSSGIWNWTRSAFGAASITEVAGTSQDVPMAYSISLTFRSLVATLLCDGTDGFEVAFTDAAVNTLLSSQESRFDGEVNSIEISQLSPSPSQKQFIENMSRVTLPSFPVSLYGDRSLKILRIAPSPGHPAAHLAFRKYHPSGSEKGSFIRTKVSIALQPVILWTDIDTVQKLTQALDRIQAHVQSAGAEEDAETSLRTECKVNLSVPSLRMFVSAADRGSTGCFLAIDVGGTGAQEAQELVYEHRTGSRGKLGSITLAVTDSMLGLVFNSRYAEVLRLRGDSQGKACVSVKWTKNSTGPRIARKIWDGIAEKCVQSGKNDIDYAFATCLNSDSTTAAVELLTSTSSSNVHITIPRLRLTFADQFALFDLLASLTMSDLDLSCSQTVSQTIFTFEVREVQAVANVSRFVEASSKGVKMTDVLQLRTSRLKVVAGTGLGGCPGALYLHFSLGEGELLERSRNARLVCWRASAVGRGDGGAQNALSRGTAGLGMSLVSWPGNVYEPDTLVTGCLRGATIFTQAANFDWLPAVVKFLEGIRQPFQTVGRPAETSSRPYFLFDLHDVALCYEPADSRSVSCALAVAALRVSSGEGRTNDVEEYSISGKDLALHLVEAKSRKPGDEGGASLNSLGYAQVAKAPVVSAIVKLSSEGYEVRCADNQLYLDTCSDTTAALGQLVADLQQLFAPDMQQTLELQLRTMKGKSPENVSPAAAQDIDSLFEGMVENAFACPKILQVKQVDCSTSGAVRQEASVRLVEPTKTRQENWGFPTGIGHSQPSFIEDHYFMEHIAQTSPSSSHGSGTSASEQAFENDAECKGGWYRDCPVDVFDTHVPSECESPRNNAKTESKYPPSLGRLTFKGWKISWRLYGGSDWTNARQKDRCVEVSLVGMDVHYDAFAPTGLYASSVLVEIQDVHVYDFSADARWKLILGYYHNRSRPRESTSKAVVVRMDAVRPNPMLPLEEYRLSLALLPICLHLDQAHIDFFAKFFQSEKKTDDASSPASGANEDAILPFFQVCEMRPLIIRVDYIPRRLDFGALRSGNCFELFNMVSWKGVELQLKSVSTSGVYGWSSLMGLLLGEWLEDIFPRQVHKLLQAFGPIRPLYAVSSGAAKLIVLPAEQYKRDRRFFKGMRKGAVAFLQSISVEALGLGANLAAGVHQILLHTEMGLGGRIPPDRKDAKRRCQPGDTREGFQQAYESLAQGLERTAVSLVGNPVKVYQRGGGAGEAIASVIKASPAAILAPASATADAVRHAFLGVRNGLDPDRKRENDRGEWK